MSATDGFDELLARLQPTPAPAALIAQALAAAHAIDATQRAQRQHVALKRNDSVTEGIGQHDPRGLGGERPLQGNAQAQRSALPPALLPPANFPQQAIRVLPPGQPLHQDPAVGGQFPAPTTFHGILGPPIPTAALVMTPFGLIFAEQRPVPRFSTYDPERDIPGLHDGGREELPGSRDGGGGVVRVKKRGLKHEGPFMDPPDDTLPTGVGSVVVFIYEPPGGTRLSEAGCELQFVNFVTRTTTYWIIPPPDGTVLMKPLKLDSLSRERGLDNGGSESSPTYPGVGTDGRKLWKVDQPHVDDELLQQEARRILKGIIAVGGPVVCFKTEWVLEAWVVKICRGTAEGGAYYEILNEKTEVTSVTSCWDAQGTPSGEVNVQTWSGGPARKSNEIPEDEKDVVRRKLRKFAKDDPAWGNPR